MKERFLRCGVVAIVAALLVACGPSCPNPAQECVQLSGYLTYDKGVLDPKTMCGASVQGGGLHFHWDMPSGTCACDVDDSSVLGAAGAKWKNCAFTTASSPATDGASSGGDGGGTGGGGTGGGGTGGGGTGGGGT